MTAFPDNIIKAAQGAQHVYPDIPASVALAQWAVESNWGRSIPEGSNNFFGIKAVPGQAFVASMTWEDYDGHWVRVQQKFAKYDDLTGSFLAHAKLLASSSFYSAARAQSNVHDFVVEMAKRYATAPNYASVINGVINAYNLTQYDAARPAPEAAKKPVPSDFPLHSIKWVQCVVGVDPDGLYGDDSEEAVKAFQTSHGLTADGVVGPLTLAALDKVA